MSGYIEKEECLHELALAAVSCKNAASKLSLRLDPNQEDELPHHVHLLTILRSGLLPDLSAVAMERRKADDKAKAEYDKRLMEMSLLGRSIGQYRREMGL